MIYAISILVDNLNAEQTYDSITAVQKLCRNARAACARLRAAPSKLKQQALHAAADFVRADTDNILAINADEVAAAAAAGADRAFLDRLRLTSERITAVSAGIEAVAALPDPVGVLLEQRVRPNGLRLDKITVPIGVIAMICESRPAVAADAGALAIYSGNALVLRSGSESFASSKRFLRALQLGLAEVGLPESAVTDVGTTDRSAVGELLRGAGGNIDLLIPRGGASLVRRVLDDARVPVLAHAAGLCHTYLDAEAAPAMAANIVLNAKMRRTGICGATETLLVHKAFLPHLSDVLRPLQQAGCELRVDAAARAALSEDIKTLPVTPADADTEYLEAILAVYVVESLHEAVTHIAEHGSGHTECIVSADTEAAKYFLSRVDSAIVMHNTSTQFADGGEFGMGAEIGIATGRMHARGPVGLAELVTYKWVVHGDGQIRG